MLGYHISKEGSTYEECLTKAVKENGIKAAQIFVAGPRSTNLIKMDYEKVRKTIKKLDIKLYAHNTHLGHPWSGNERTFNLIKEEIRVCKLAGILGLVIHLPKKPLETIMEILPTLVDPDIMILLEIPSVKPDPDMSWETPEKINKLCRAIRKAKIQNVEICIDTCHIFTSGHDVTTSKMATDWLNSLRYPNMIGMIHLNDSAVPLGNGRDVHARIFDGLIWRGIKPSKSGLKPFVKFAIDYDIPIILERSGVGNDGTEEELALLRKIFNL